MNILLRQLLSCDEFQRLTFQYIEMLKIFKLEHYSIGKLETIPKLDT